MPRPLVIDDDELRSQSPDELLAVSVPDCVEADQRLAADHISPVLIGAIYLEHLNDFGNLFLMLPRSDSDQ